MPTAHELDPIPIDLDSYLAAKQQAPDALGERIADLDRHYGITRKARLRLGATQDAKAFAWGGVILMAATPYPPGWMWLVWLAVGLSALVQWDLSRSDPFA